MYKKAFTLFELIIVITLVSIVYYLTLSNFDINKKQIDTITLTNLKQTLLKIDFEDNISIKCVDDENIDCLVIVDGEIQETKIKNLFTNCPDVYEYSKEQIKIEFDDLELEQLEYLNICFEFNINKNKASSQMIVDTNNEVFIYDNISNEPIKIKYLKEISLYFDKKNDEVKNVF